MSKSWKENLIFKPESKRYLMYATPSEGGYGYTLIPIGSRYDHGSIQLSEELIKKVLDEASPYYPILIVDGYQIDGLLDYISQGKRSVVKSFGEFPRKIMKKGSEETPSSIDDFKQYFHSAKAVSRIVQEDLKKVEDKIRDIRRSIKWHETSLQKEYKQLEETTKELSSLRDKWQKVMLSGKKQVR